MCLVVFAWQAHPEYRLLLAANRDEFHARPAEPAHWWPDAPDVLAGRDLQAGGTWLAVSRAGRFATVTNYREQQQSRGAVQSRGAIVTDFVNGHESPQEFVESLDGAAYAGVNVIVADRESLCYVSNRGDSPQQLAPGVYGLSNASLDTPWSKLVRARDGLAGLIETGEITTSAMQRLLADRKPAPVAEVDSGELPFNLARALTAPFIVAGDYGTRSSTVLEVSADGRTRFLERRFGADGQATGDSAFSFQQT